MVGNYELAKTLGATVADTVKIRLHTEILHLHPDVILPDPNQPRKEFDKDGLARLASSLQGYGQLQPVVVRKEKGQYILVAGERRWRAAKLAGMPRVEAKLIIGGDFQSLQLIENLLREDLKPVEQARAYKAIMEREGWTARELSRRLNLEHSGVSKALKLLRLDPEVQDAVDEGRIPHTTAYEIAKKPQAEQAPLARAAVEGRLKGNDLRQRATPAPAPKVTLPRLTLGSVVASDAWTYSTGRIRVDVTGHRNQEGLIAALEKALDAAFDGKKSLAGGTGRVKR